MSHECSALVGVVLSTIALSATPASAQEPTAAPAGSVAVASAGAGEPVLGLGVILGDPTAVGARYWMAPSFAVQAWLGASVRDAGPELALAALWGKRGLGGGGGGVTFDLALGGGLALGSVAGETDYHCHEYSWRFCHRNDDPDAPYLELRGSASVGAVVRAISLEIFVELAPGFDLARSERIERGRTQLDAGLGVRYYPF